MRITNFARVNEVLVASFPELHSDARSPLQVLEELLADRAAAQQLGALVWAEALSAAVPPLKDALREQQGWDRAPMIEVMGPASGLNLDEQRQACKYLEERGLIEHGEKLIGPLNSRELFLEWKLNVDRIEKAIRAFYRLGPKVQSEVLAAGIEHPGGEGS